MANRICLNCDQPLRGRIDKKFCSDQCRNTYNNNLNNDFNGYVQKVNRILRKNRRILAELNPHGKSKVPKEKLVAKGYNFNYITNLFQTKNGNTYYFCYDYGYLQIEKNLFALVIKDEYVDKKE